MSVPTYRAAIVINHRKVPNEDQSNFPVLVSGVYPYLATTAHGGKVTSASGYDITFTSDAAGLSLLNWEIESYNATTGAINFWVKIPTLSHTANTVIYMFYGDSSITTFQGGATGSVWDVNFTGVYHFSNASGLGENDSTANGNTLVTATAPGGTNPGTTAAGSIDGAVHFNGTNQGLQSPNTAPSAATDFTCSFWANPDTLTPPNSPLLTGQNVGTVNFLIYMGVDAAGAAKAGAFAYYDGSVWMSTDSVSSDPVVAGAWQYFTVVRSGSTRTLYYNGQPIVSGAAAKQSITPNVIQIGNAPFGQYITGLMDEVRISNSARDANWIAAEYNNQSSPATFYSVILSPNPVPSNPVLAPGPRINPAHINSPRTTSMRTGRTRIDG